MSKLYNPEIVEELYRDGEGVIEKIQALARLVKPAHLRLGYSERANHGGLAKCRLGFSWISIWRHCGAVDLDIHRAELSQDEHDNPARKPTHGSSLQRP
jgi:hypothetical protein